MSVTIAGLTDLVEIGRGGFAIVYRARQEAVGRYVAVKVLAALDLDNDEQRRFRQECRAMGALSSHPNIVQVFDAGSSAEGLPFIVMEYMTGGSLWQKVRRTGPLPANDLCDVGVQMCGALESAHRSGILHRDIKPENILLDAAGAHRLTDFGIAAVNDGTRSLSGAVSGTIAFLPPEVVRGERATERSDVYELGATLHALACGAVPFRRPTDENPVSALARILHEEPADLGTLGVPRPLVDTIRTAMAKDPADRYPTAAAFGDALVASQRALGLPPSRLIVVNADLPERSDDTIALSPRSEVSGRAGATAPDATVGVPTTVRPPAGAGPLVATSAAPGRRRLSAIGIGLAISLVVGAVVAAAVVLRAGAERGKPKEASSATSAVASPTIPSSVSANPPVPATAGASPSDAPTSSPVTTALAATLASAAPTSLTTVRTSTSAPPPASLEPLAVGVARSYATALAAHDWPTARELNPTLPDDAALDKGYRYLDEQLVVDAETAPTGNNLNDLRLLVLAHESPPGGVQTSFWCFHWQVDSIAHTVRAVDGRRLQTYPGTLPADSTPAELVEGCRSLDLK